MAIRQELTKRWNQLKQDAEDWRKKWLDIKDWEMPEHGRFLSNESQEEVNYADTDRSNIIDETPENAIEKMAAGLQTGMSSPANPWFSLKLQDEKLMKYRSAKVWLKEVEDILRGIFAGGRIYDGLIMLYTELGPFGTAAASLEESFKTTVYMRPYTIGEYFLATNQDREVDTFARRTWLTARQIVYRWGLERSSQQVRTAFDNSPEQRFEVAHLIEPNDDRMSVRDPVGRRFRSIYWETGAQEELVLSIGGFEEWPVLTPRWKVVSDDVYGRGQGMVMLGTIKMLQSMQRDSLIALKKLIDPPLTGGAENDEINTLPGGISYPKTNQLGDGTLKPLYQISPDFRSIEYKIEQVKYAIRQGFFNDMFQMISSQPADGRMTATEIVERQQEKLTLLGPVLERISDEVLRPLISRTFSIAQRQGKIPPPPPELADMPLFVEFVSPLAQAQKIMSQRSTEQFVGFVGNLAAVNPDVLDKVDFDRGVEIYADNMGVDPSLMRRNEDVQAIREARAQAQAQAAQQEKQLADAQAAKLMSEAKTGQGSVLDVALGGLGGQI